MLRSNGVVFTTFTRRVQINASLLWCSQLHKLNFLRALSSWAHIHGFPCHKHKLKSSIWMQHHIEHVVEMFFRSGDNEGKVHSCELDNSVSLLSCMDGNHCDKYKTGSLMKNNNCLVFGRTLQLKILKQEAVNSSLNIRKLLSQLHHFYFNRILNLTLSMQGLTQVCILLDSFTDLGKHSLIQLSVCETVSWALQGNTQWTTKLDKSDFKLRSAASTNDAAFYRHTHTAKLRLCALDLSMFV